MSETFIRAARALIESGDNITIPQILYQKFGEFPKDSVVMGCPLGDITRLFGPGYIELFKGEGITCVTLTSEDALKEGYYSSMVLFDVKRLRELIVASASEIPGGEIIRKKIPTIPFSNRTTFSSRPTPSGVS